MITLLNLFLIFIMTFLASFAALQLKLASAENNVVRLFFNFHFIFGVSLYVFCSLMNIYLLKNIAYGVLLPTSSITYIWTLILSAILLKEHVSLGKIWGVFLIISGCILLNLPPDLVSW